MKGTTGVSLDRVARLLGAERVGPVEVHHGAFGAAELTAAVQARLNQTPSPVDRDLSAKPAAARASSRA